MAESYLSFRRPDRECLLCGKLLEPEGRHPSILRLPKDKEEAVREDFCGECWEKKGERDYFSFWVTRRLQQAASAQERRLARSERNAALWALFAALTAQPDESLAPQVFLLAHLLMRYRVLVYQGTAEDGRLAFLHPPTRETFLIQDVPLDATLFAEAKGRLDEHLRQHAQDAAETVE